MAFSLSSRFVLISQRPTFNATDILPPTAVFRKKMTSHLIRSAVLDPGLTLKTPPLAIVHPLAADLTAPTRS